MRRQTGLATLFIIFSRSECQMQIRSRAHLILVLSTAYLREPRTRGTDPLLLGRLREVCSYPSSSRRR